MSHHCQAVIVHCIDFRLQRALKKFLEEQNLLGDCDIVSAGGAAKNSEFVLGQVDIAKRLHGIRKAYLINHTDCGAYGGSQAFASKEEERKKHEEDLKNARKLILTKYPDLEINTLLAEIHPSGEATISKV